MNHSYRRAIVIIDLKELQIYDAYDIGEALQTLPDDTKIISFGHELNRAMLSIVIENYRFKEIKECELYPELKIIEKENETLYINCDSVIEVKYKAGDELFLPTEVKINSYLFGCEHIWKEYNGLNDKYMYCTVCDIKNY